MARPDTGKKFGWGAANTIAVALTLIPVLWIVSLSFKTPAGILDATFWPKQWAWSNYSGILQSSQFIRQLLNSIGIGLIATVIAQLLPPMVAYPVARLHCSGTPDRIA